MTPNPLSQDFIEQLTEYAGLGNILTSQADCIAYGYDNSKLQATPQAVVLASDTEQLEKIIALCYQHAVPLIARGRGTGTTGATVPDLGGVVLSFERMNSILEIDADNRLARVQPGVLNQVLQDELAELGFFWPP